jgi:hypothetical protein
LELVHDPLSVPTMVCGPWLPILHPGELVKHARIPQAHAFASLRIALIEDIKAITGRTQVGTDPTINARLGQCLPYGIVKIDLDVGLVQVCHGTDHRSQIVLSRCPFPIAVQVTLLKKVFILGHQCLSLVRHDLDVVALPERCQDQIRALDACRRPAEGSAKARVAWLIAGNGNHHRAPPTRHIGLIDIPPYKDPVNDR